MRRAALWAACLASLALGTGCHQDMWLQPKTASQSKASIFPDAGGSQAPVAGTVEFGKPMTDEAFYTGRVGGKLVAEFPVPVTEELMRRGKERYEIFCLNCHGAVGDGQGMIAKRGFTLARPVGNYHTDRLRAMPVGHFFDVMTEGFGTMYPLRGRMSPHDRWAVAAYVRALQASQHTPVSELPAEERQRLQAMAASPDQNAAPEPQVMPKKPTTVPIGRPPVPGSRPAAPPRTSPPDDQRVLEPAGGAR
jgi:mono/diheme cytochrome c family protein